MTDENAPEQPGVAPESVEQAQAELADPQGSPSPETGAQGSEEQAAKPEKDKKTRKRVASDAQPMRVGRTFMVLPTNRSLVETFPSEEPGPERFEPVDPQPEDFEQYVRKHGRWDR